MSDSVRTQPIDYFKHCDEAYRGIWWNADYLALIADRLSLGEVRSVVDVGSGHGHWTFALLPVLSSEAAVIGVEAQQRYVDVARARALEIGAHNCDFRLGAAHAIPVPDASADLVTCQTVLMHLGNPQRALAEMFRVLRPGGLLLLAEPNNAVEWLVSNSVTATWSRERVLERVNFYLTCQDGKRVAGHGDNSIGDKLPGMLSRLGATDIDVYMNDKPDLMVERMADSTAGETRRAQFLQWDRAGIWVWPQEVAQRHFVAGGGNLQEFESCWRRRREEQAAMSDQLESGEYAGSGAVMLYLVSGRRPPAA